MKQGDVYAADLSSMRDEQVFEQVFKTNFKNLHAYACTILKNEAAAEEMVQQVFYKIWEKKDELTIHVSVKAYLYRSVHNLCLNQLTHQQVKASHQSYTMQQAKHYEEDSASARVRQAELESNIRKALNELPEQCRTIFQMSRFEDLKYHEIAKALGISIKTVENQMGKALKLMRLKLVEFLPLLIILFRL
ncbi:RNA polymerase sigma-70 factor [Foetidibacter luteolus]|uniref:RNA polymerase sigma-70 factor n=1 Tax=Foetidibacter luteolus TaxID=2608880 RepID=UPI00129B465F|nr:RNA polymerase sigma-70 factor [Foetidibacter luteolus]